MAARGRGKKADSQSARVKSLSAAGETSGDLFGVKAVLLAHHRSSSRVKWNLRYTGSMHVVCPYHLYSLSTPSSTPANYILRPSI